MPAAIPEPGAGALPEDGRDTSCERADATPPRAGGRPPWPIGARERRGPAPLSQRPPISARGAGSAPGAAVAEGRRVALGRSARCPLARQSAAARPPPHRAAPLALPPSLPTWRPPSRGSAPRTTACSTASSSCCRRGSDPFTTTRQVSGRSPPPPREGSGAERSPWPPLGSAEEVAGCGGSLRGCCGCPAQGAGGVPGHRAAGPAGDGGVRRPAAGRGPEPGPQSAPRHCDTGELPKRGLRRVKGRLLLFGN